MFHGSVRALLIALILAASATPLGPVAAPVEASSSVIVTATDPHKDAKITHAQGLSTHSAAASTYVASSSPTGARRSGSPWT